MAVLVIDDQRGARYTEFDFRMQRWCVFLELLFQYLLLHIAGRLTNCVPQMLTIRGRVSDAPDGTGSCRYS